MAKVSHMAELRKTVNVPAELYDAVSALLPEIRKIKGHRVTMASFVEEAMNKNLQAYNAASAGQKEKKGQKAS